MGGSSSGANGGSGGSDAVCAPGQQVTCPCVGGVDGVQACNSDGSGYEPCQCPDEGVAGTAGTSAAATSSSKSDDGGCGCRVENRDSTPAPWVLMIGLGVLGLGRRRLR